jgi:hypothetical protein
MLDVVDLVLTFVTTNRKHVPVQRMVIRDPSRRLSHVGE